MSRINAAVVLLVGAFGGTAAARDSVGSPDTFSYPLSGLEFARSPVAKSNLLRLVPVERELKLTEAQKKRQAAIFQQRLESMRKALIEYGNEEILAAARNATFADAEAALEVSLEPEQRDRLDQIQLQVQGPLAFTRRDFQERLGLTADQVDDIEPIVERGNDEVEKASSFSLELNRNAMQSAEAIRKLVDGLEFQLKKEQTRHVARASRLGVTVRIVKVLTDSQRVAYRKMLGEPFDIGKLPPGIDTRERDINIIASRLGLTGQRADLLFDVKVSRPAYLTAHPRVLIDEAHENFHTASGRYKPFATLIGNDGYAISSNKQKFTRKALEACDILVIANATVAGPMNSPGAVKSAFADEECQAVHDWVKAGGSLLLITDHEPFGSPSEDLAKRFGVEMSKTVARDAANANSPGRGLLFTREKNLLGDHPITRGRDESERINRVATFTGQSLLGPPGSVHLLKFAATATVGRGKDPGPATGWSQGLALTYGQGRVVVLGEAAQLSAQLTGLGRETTNMMGMNVPGIDNRQMALNIMHWLSGALEPRQASLKQAG